MEVKLAYVLNRYHDDHNIMTYSLLKLVNGSMHRNETSYACVLNHFRHDGLPPFTEIYVVVYKNEWRQVN